MSFSEHQLQYTNVTFYSEMNSLFSVGVTQIKVLLIDIAIGCCTLLIGFCMNRVEDKFVKQRLIWIATPEIL